MFAEAVAAIDNGNLGGLRSLLGVRPELLSARLENRRENYFARPSLLWFVACPARSRASAACSSS
jgi:hypothetical protein